MSFRQLYYIYDVFRSGTFRERNSSIALYRGMKRKATDPDLAPKSKRQKEPEKDYCDATPQKDNGNIVWPAKWKAIEEARAFLTAWYTRRLLHSLYILISLFSQCGRAGKDSHCTRQRC